MVEIVVRVPENTSPWQQLFLAGDGPLGDWSAAGAPLAPCDDGAHRAWLDLPPAFVVRFLVTPGRWRGAETDAHGREHPPRSIPPGARHLEVHVGGWGRNSVRYHPEFTSRFLPHARTISVWLPPGYGSDPDRRYPVFYMHDGQNLFDAHTAFAGNPWLADEVAEREIRAGRVPPLIIVGVANTSSRLDEYGPRRGADGPARAYGRFLVEEVKPFIDRTYRTRPEPEHTGVGGSSMGGLISLHLCDWYPNVFRKCAAMSPSLWWDRECLLRTATESLAGLDRCRVWLDVGEYENSSTAGSAMTVRRTRRLARIFERHGLRAGEQFEYVEVPGGTHNEASWGGRFDRVLRFLFGV
ncbi:MAG: esterase [Planctomycetes bacterium]|nr:esterase [Planctomycetota bacterium]